MLKNAETDAGALARLWGRALGMSPASNALPLFRRQVESFFDAYATDIWGTKADPAHLKKIFNRAAQADRKPPRRKR